MIKVSGGSARVAQGLTLVLFMPFLMFLTYIILSKNLTKEGLSFLVPVLIVSGIIIRHSFSCADIYKKEGFVIIKKLFHTKKIAVNDIKEIGETLWPFTYFMVIRKKKILFFSGAYDLFKEIVSDKPKAGIENMKSKIKENEKEI